MVFGIRFGINGSSLTLMESMKISMAWTRWLENLTKLLIR